MICKVFHLLIGIAESIRNRFNVCRLLGVNNFYSRWLMRFFNKDRCTRPSVNNSLVSIKQSVMKPKNIQQEILVFTQTSFAQKKSFVEKRNSNEITCSAEELEKAFWNGMLNEMLPELMLPLQRQVSELSIWQISTGESSLLIDMAETPDIVEDSRSINPYLFLSTSNIN